jgi:hypothetical protein
MSLSSVIARLDFQGPAGCIPQSAAAFTTSRSRDCLFARRTKRQLLVVAGRPSRGRSAAETVPRSPKTGREPGWNASGREVP